MSMSNAKLVTIYGGSGFIGRYIARQMAKEGWRVRVAVRRPNEAIFVRPYGVVGQLEPILCNVRDDASVAAAMEGADAVVNCVGILSELGKNKFDAVQHEGAERIARLAAAESVKNLVHVSAIGADADAESDYAKTKALGEEGALSHFSAAVILRPSIVFGPEDEFFNRFAAMSRLGPVLPVVGADTRFQPVYVEDVARAAVLAATGQVEAGIYELGGPDVSSFRELMQEMLTVVNRRRLVLNIPFLVASIMGGIFDIIQSVSGGLLPNKMITRDQVRNLRNDNVVSEGARTLETLGIDATSYRVILPDYLWQFRPSGQYDAIKDSAKNLRS